MVSLIQKYPRPQCGPLLGQTLKEYLVEKARYRDEYFDTLFGVKTVEVQKNKSMPNQQVVFRNAA